MRFYIDADSLCHSANTETASLRVGNNQKIKFLKCSFQRHFSGRNSRRPRHSCKFLTANCRLTYLPVCRKPSTSVGDIIIIDIRPELKPHQDLIGEEILKIHKNIKTVLAKAGDISGVYRIREYTSLCGENKTRTSPSGIRLPIPR